MGHFKNLPIGNLFLSHSGTNAITATIYTSRTALILGNNDENVEAVKTLLAKNSHFIHFKLK